MMTEQKITKSLINLFHKAGISYAVLGTEESCSGDPAKRAGNNFIPNAGIIKYRGIEFYSIKKIVTACPHCFNTIKMNILIWVLI